MPGFDRTGPLGQGPMTGRRRGWCADDEPGSTGYGWGFGRGLGRGRFGGWGRGGGLGFGRGFGFFGYGRNPEASDEESVKNEINFLKNQISWLEKMLGKKGNDAE